jgi:hypothetical protein
MRIPGADKAIANLMKWSVKDDWRPYREQVFANHFEAIHDRFGTTEDDIAELLGHGYGMLFGTVFEDFMAARFGEDGEENIVEDYLKRRGWREKVPGKRYLEAIKNSVLSLHEVVALDPGHTLTVRDMVLGGDAVTVKEKLGSESAARWDRIAGRIVRVNGKNYFTGAMMLFPHGVADEVLSSLEEIIGKVKNRLRREAKKLKEPVNFEDADVRAKVLSSSAHLFTRIFLTDVLDRASAPIPDVRNSDGDELMPSEVRFPINGEIAEVIAGLDAIDGFARAGPGGRRWTWHAPCLSTGRVGHGTGATLESGGEPGRTILGGIEIAKGAVVLSTNSKARADQGRELLSSGLEALVGPPLTSHQTLESMLEEHRAAPPARAEPATELPTEATAQIIHSFLDSHYRQALDEPLPFLGGKTPRLTARTKKGRAQVVRWLKKLENTETRRAAGQGQQPYDFQWMWREMKIDDPL